MRPLCVTHFLVQMQSIAPLRFNKRQMHLSGIAGVNFNAPNYMKLMSKQLKTRRWHVIISSTDTSPAVLRSGDQLPPAAWIAICIATSQLKMRRHRVQMGQNMTMHVYSGRWFPHKLFRGFYLMTECAIAVLRLSLAASSGGYGLSDECRLRWGIHLLLRAMLIVIYRHSSIIARAADEPAVYAWHR